MEGRDIPSVVSLDRQVFHDPWPESAYVQEIYFNPQAHYFVLELLDPTLTRTWHDHRRQRTARLLGFAGMRVEGRRGHISTLAVRSEWRGQRLGEALLLTAVDQAAHDGAHLVGLEVRVSNDVAQALYTKYGFSHHSRLERYYANGEDAYYMQLQLVGSHVENVVRVRESLSALLEDLRIDKVAVV
ncbi:MAG: ribosomal protein S18-alanine N-acetyltransferase [Anaerolineae bacterium]|nr:ribosomal protein S18-alanine N-acetyltransferase [Anaerolineae bacterium]